MEYTVGTSVFGDWTIKEKLGEGASGQVFEINKRQGGIMLRAAMKVIRVPQSQDDVRRVMSEGMTMESASTYFSQVVEEIKKEIRTMIELSGHPNIVRFEDYVYVPHGDRMGGDILIRMELLQSLNEYMIAHSMAEIDVRQMARDLCAALDFCHKKRIIHRDIKPENIFVSEAGQFKLGDFGLAKTVEKSTGGLSKKGTESYMAPEVFLGKKYDCSVDIYSLGLVLYKCMNRNRLPFFPIDKAFSYADREAALTKRIMGEALPLPVDAGNAFGEIILKACAFEPAKRYQSAAELVSAINDGLDNAKKVNKVYSNNLCPCGSGKKYKQCCGRKKQVDQKSQSGKKNSKNIVIGVAALVIVGVINSIGLQDGDHSESKRVVENTQSVVSSQKTDDTAGTYVLTADTDLRAQPDSNSETVGRRIPDNSFVYVMETDESGNWRKVWCFGMEGWMPANAMNYFSSENNSVQVGSFCYVNTSPGNASSVLEMRKEPQDTADVLGNFWYGAEFYIESIKDGWGKVSYGGETGWVDLGKVSTYIENGYYYVIADSGLKMRSEPDTSAESVGKLNAGDVVQAEEFQKGWAKITHNGTSGWVALKYMNPCSG